MTGELFPAARRVRAAHGRHVPARPSFNIAPSTIFTKPPRSLHGRSLPPILSSVTAATAIPRRVCVAGAVCHWRVRTDARAGSAARAGAGIFRRADQSARGDYPARLRRLRAGRGGGGNVFDATARFEISQAPRRAVADAADSTARNHHQPSGACRAGAFHLRPGCRRRLPRPEHTAYWTDPKVVWSIFMWLVYLALLVLRRFFRHRAAVLQPASLPRSPSCC